MKQSLHHSPKIQIRRSSIHGWGVFASQPIGKGETLEECPFYKLSMFSNAMETVRFYWPRDQPWDFMAVPAGFAMLYNHSDPPNANWETIEKEMLFRFFAVRDIAEGEEIFIDYGVNYSW